MVKSMKEFASRFRRGKTAGKQKTEVNSARSVKSEKLKAIEKTKSKGSVGRSLKRQKREQLRQLLDSFPRELAAGEEAVVTDVARMVQREIERELDQLSADERAAGDDGDRRAGAGGGGSDSEFYSSRLEVRRQVSVATRPEPRTAGSEYDSWAEQEDNFNKIYEPIDFRLRRRRRSGDERHGQERRQVHVEADVRVVRRGRDLERRAPEGHSDTDFDESDAATIVRRGHHREYVVNDAASERSECDSWSAAESSKKTSDHVIMEQEHRLKALSRLDDEKKRKLGAEIVEMVQPVSVATLRKQRQVRELRKQLSGYTGDWETLEDIKAGRKEQLVRDLRQKLAETMKQPDSDDRVEKIKSALRSVIEADDVAALPNVNLGLIYVPMEENMKANSGSNKTSSSREQNTDADTFGSLDSLIFEPKPPSTEAILEEEETEKRSEPSVHEDKEGSSSTAELLVYDSRHGEPLYGTRNRGLVQTAAWCGAYVRTSDEEGSDGRPLVFRDGRPVPLTEEMFRQTSDEASDAERASAGAPQVEQGAGAEAGVSAQDENAYEDISLGDEHEVEDESVPEDAATEEHSGGGRSSPAMQQKLDRLAKVGAVPIGFKKRDSMLRELKSKLKERFNTSDTEPEPAEGMRDHLVRELSNGGSVALKREQMESQFSRMFQAARAGLIHVPPPPPPPPPPPAVAMPPALAVVEETSADEGDIPVEVPTPGL
ncbi:hypothetical protein FJT64_022138 [Amphibalanus amphitrite]|uniref:Uncharacterized protein n=1 Tax=Amphibalanus amphitrite TaxID=1232801 RepID=A0A6A4WRJ0_AMPAM|nr:hypothetical protein FJT64_022138 [Amphibalanus amphitrite]